MRQIKMFNAVKTGDSIYFVRNFDTLNIKPKVYVVDVVTPIEEFLELKCHDDDGVGLVLNVESFCSAVKTVDGVYFMNEVQAYDKIAKRKMRKIEELKNELKLRKKSYMDDIKKISELSLKDDGEDMVHG